MIDDLASHGFATTDHLLDADAVDRAAAALDEVLDAEADVAPERGWATDVHRVAYALPAKHATFAELIGDDRLTSLARAVLGDDVVLSTFNGIDIVAGSPGQALHRDHPHLTPGSTLTLHLVVALDPFAPENGSTRVVPGSHLADVDAEAVALAVPAGGGVAFDGALVHGAGPNATDRRRRALHLFYVRPWVQPHWDLLASMPPERRAALAPEQRRLLGEGRGPRRVDHVARRVVR